MRWRTVSFAAIALLILLPLAALAIFVVSFDPNRYAPDLIAAVDQTTGRNLVLGSKLTFKLSLHPTIQASDLVLANPPGFADRDFMTLQRLEARIALLPLWSHHLDIADLVLVQPDLVLERDRLGHADSEMPAASGSAVPGQPAPGASHGYKVTLEAVDVQDGQLTIKGAGAKTAVFALTRLTGKADSGTAPLAVNALAAYNGTPFSITGSVGSVARFSGSGTGAGTGPWPINLLITANGATADIAGGIDDPAGGHGYDVTVNAQIPNLQVLKPLLPPGLLAASALPKLQAVTITARIVDQRSAIPAIDKLVIKAGPSDLSAVQPGLALTALDVEMASLDQPLTLFAAGSIGGLALSATGKFGAVQSLFNPALLPASMPPQASFPVALQVQAGTATFSATGAIATPAQLAGVALAVNVAVPDLSILGALAGTPLPAWKNIQLQTTLIDPGGLGLRQAAGLDALVASMDNASFGGAASLYFGAQPRLQAELNVRQADLDALLAAFPSPPPALAVAPPVVPQASPPPPPPAPLVIPAQNLPLGWLKTASADVQLAADSLTFNHASYTALQAHAVLAGGVLTLNPVTAEVPGGAVTATASLDATHDPVQASLSIDAPALALPPFLQAAGLPDTAQGTMQARLNATGTGDSPHAMAATMDGQLGLALVNGIVDGRVLDALFGAMLRTVGLPESLVGAQGPAAVRCFALRMDASNGIGTVRALTLDSDRLLVQGGGTVDFGNETLGIVLRPQLQIAGSPVGLPMQIGGTFAQPVDSLAAKDLLASAGGTALGLANALAGQAGGGHSLLGNVAAAIGLAAAPDVCPDALSLGRLGQPGPAAAPMTAAPAGPGAPPATSGPKSLLNSLFGN